MEEQFQKENNNIIELNEDIEEQNKKQKVNQTPTRHLRDIKKVNYSKFFSDEQDNSEEYEPEEKSEKAESTKKRPRPKSVSKSNVGTTKKKKEEEQNPEKKMEVEEENEDKKNKNQTGYGYIINIDETFAKYVNTSNDNTTNNPNNTNIPNNELILIIMEICLNGLQYGLEKDNSSRLFWEEVGKIDKFKPITSKFKTETLRKYWRTIRETKKFKKIISETKKYANELNNNNLKLLSSIKIICEFVSSHSKRKIDYYLNKHICKPASKSKKINVNDMSPSEQIADVINTFMSCFPKKKEKDIIDALLQTSFDIENAFLLLKDRENLGFFAYSEKDDEIVKRNYENNDDKNEEYIELINVKGLEDVIRRKEFLFNVKIDRSQYNKVEEEIPIDNEEKNDNKIENKDENKEKNIEENNEKGNNDIEEKEEGKKDDKEKVKDIMNG